MVFVSLKLKSLDISYCQELTERGINSLLRKKSCVTSFSVRQGTLSDLSLGLLCENFRQLRSLNIASVKSITGNGLISLAKSLRHLDFIDLSWASGSSKNIFPITCTHLSTKCNAYNIILEYCLYTIVVNDPLILTHLFIQCYVE